MKRRYKILIPLIFTPLLFACSQVKEGTITEKDYNPPYTTYDTQCVTYSNGVCSGRITLPHNHPESFKLKVENDSGKHSWIHVPKNEYDCYVKGQQYPQEHPC